MGAVDPATLIIVLVAAAKSEPSKAGFYIAGGVLAAWAVIVSVIGITQPDFPGSLLRSRLVMALSVVLVLGAVSTAVITAGTPAKGKERAKQEPGRGPAAPPTGGPAQSQPAASATVALAADPSGQLRFDKTQLQAKAGRVAVGFVNKSPVGHDVTIEQNGAKVAGSSVITASTTSFTADLKPGTYTFYCSVDSHRQLGMKGTLTAS